MKFNHLVYSKEDGVLTITLNRPQVKNALNMELIMELNQAIELVRTDHEARVIIITGAGDTFCSGGDLTFLANLTKVDSEEEHAEMLTPFIAALIAIYRLEKPTIAAINGPAVGDGIEICLCCDIRIASEKALFSEMFVRLGAMPILAGYYFLPRMVGLGKAYEMVFTGEAILAQEAYRIGLVNRVVPEKEFTEAVKKLAGYLASGPTKTLGLIKKAVQYALLSDLEGLSSYVLELQKISLKLDDSKEGIMAALEKRRPLFKG